MSKILVIQAHKMLQQAIILALSPDHQIEAADSIPETERIAGFDALVVDAGSLRKDQARGAQAYRRFEGWQVPIIWIDSDESPSPPTRVKLVRVKKPIARESLIAALAECLGTMTGVAKAGPGRRAVKQSPDSGNQNGLEENNSVAPPPRAYSRIIELVDVVEAGPRRKTRIKQEKKKK